MSDLMNEVDDDLRRQKLEQFWLENRNWIIGGILLAIVSTAGMTWWRSYTYQQNVLQTQGLLQAIDSNDAGKLADYAKTGDRNHAALAKLTEAGLLVQKKQADDAVKIYNDIADTTGVDGTLREYARLLSVMQRLDKDDPQKLHGEIEKMSRSGHAFHFSALEMDALLYAKENNLKTAIDRLAIIAGAADAPDDVRTRAVTLRELYTASLNADAKASAKKAANDKKLDDKKSDDKKTGEDK